MLELFSILVNIYSKAYWLCGYHQQEPNNLKSKNSFRYNGLIHRKTVGIEPAKDGKGVVLVTRKSRGLSKPSKAFTLVELKKGSRQTIATVRTSHQSNNYRKDFINAGVRRACAILKSK